MIAMMPNRVGTTLAQLLLLVAQLTCASHDEAGQTLRGPGEAAAAAQRLLAKIRVGKAPSELKTVFGPWIEDIETVVNVSTALADGGIVIIENGMDARLAEGLRAELAQARFVRSDGATATGSAEEQRVSSAFNTAFFEVPAAARCAAVDALNGGEFFFSHQRPADYNSVPLSKATSTTLDTAVVRSWVEKLLDSKRGTIGSSEWGVRKFDVGDVYGLHSDDVNGRFGGLSLTAYFTDPEQQWDAKQSGGQFVWCADTNSAPVAIAPTFNTIVLFRVDRNTNHYVEPLLAGSTGNPRYVFQGWWRPSAGVFKPNSLHPDSRRVLRVRAHAGGPEQKEEL